MKTRNIIAYAAAALALAGCQRESLIPELGTPYDGIVKFAPAVTGIGSGSAVGVRSGLTDGSAVIGSESLTLSSADGRFTIPMSLSTTGADAEGVKSLAGTRATLINDPGSEVGEIKPLVGEFAALTDNTFWVAAWDMPDDDDPSQCIPDADAKAFTGYVSGDVDNGFYQKVMYRTKDAGGEALATPYWMTVQPGSAAPADDEYKWKKNEAEKTFYAYANVPAGATMAQLNDEGTLKQTLTLTELPDADILMGYYEGDGSTGDPEKQTGTAKIKFRHPFAAVKFKAGTLASGVTITGIAIEKVYGKAGEDDAGKLMVTQEGHSFTWTRADGAAFKDANLLPEVSAACDGDAVLVIPQSLPSKARIRVTLQKGGETFNVYTPLSGSWSAGYVYTYTIGYNPPPEELLPGMFSISATKYVQFSRGNLQATYNGSGYDWAFAANQYDYIGKNPGNTKIKGDGGNNDGAVVDLFGWSTEKTYYGISNSAYDGTVYSGDFRDWATAIDNSGTWCTLSADEWDYLINKRTIQGYTGLTNTCVYATVNGVEGLIIFCDDYDGPIGVGTTLTEIPEDCLFLPSAGTRTGITVDILGKGYYWSSTDTGSDAKGLFFGAGFAGIQNSNGLYYGRSVRLVQKFPKPIEYVEIAGLKWATENLAVSKSGMQEWKGLNAEHPTGHIVGDYFQWAASYEGYNVDPATATPLDLLTYTEFSHKNCVSGATSKFTFKDGGNQFYTKCATAGNYGADAVLNPSDDPASVILGGGWRMPTNKELKDLVAATYCAWDATDCGCYVFEPQGTTYPKNKFVGAIPEGLDKKDALLFFPACGYGSWETANGLLSAGTTGYYSSSTCEVAGTGGNRMHFNSSTILPDGYGYGYFGFSIRPVHD